MDRPLVVFGMSLVVLWVAAQAGWLVSHRRYRIDEDRRSDLNIILTATLTLLGLIIGFTFSMAITRYNQRKDYEAAEANAISTEYVRAGLLPAADQARVRELLRTYLNQRVLFYTTRNARQLHEINAKTARLQ